MISLNTQRRVAHLDVLGGMVFPSSIGYWQTNRESSIRVATRDSQLDPMLIGRGDAIVLNCDSNADISAPDGGLVHINGDLNANLEIGGHHELIIAGCVSQGSTITASGFHHVYIGGSVFGEIVASGSSKIWIDGDFSGSISTGTPSTNLHVMGNFSAGVKATDGADLLWLAVGGFADHDLLCSIAGIGYTQFNATVRRSNVAPGIYPVGSGRLKTDTGNSFARWCVLIEGEAEPSDATEDRW